MRAQVRFPIAAKFAVMLGVLVAALFALGFAGLRGVANLDGSLKDLDAQVRTLQLTSVVANDSSRAARVALQIVASHNEADIAHLEDELPDGTTIDATIATPLPAVAPVG
jgi:hypothetical protein